MTTEEPKMTEKDYPKLFQFKCASGDIGDVKSFVSECEATVGAIDIHADNQRALCLCLLNGYLEVADYIKELADTNPAYKKAQADCSAFIASVNSRDVRVVEWVVALGEENGHVINVNWDKCYPVYSTAASGNLGLLKYLVELGTRPKYAPLDLHRQSDCLTMSLGNGHIETALFVLALAKEQGYQWYYRRVVVAALEVGSRSPFDVAKFIKIMDFVSSELEFTLCDFSENFANAISRALEGDNAPIRMFNDAHSFYLDGIAEFFPEEKCEPPPRAKKCEIL